jgi:hypothetical protein
LTHPSPGSLPPLWLRSDPAKVELLTQLLASYESSLRETGALPPRLDGGPDDRGAAPQQQQQQNGGGDAAANGGVKGSGGGGGGASGLRPIELSEAQRRADEQERDQLAWVLHALSQHRSWLGDAEGALAASGEALERAPDVVELHSARGAILAAAGDVEGARRGRGGAGVGARGLFRAACC